MFALACLPYSKFFLGGLPGPLCHSSITENLAKLNNYSDEVVIGTYNGKPLYRKVVSYSGSISQGNWFVIDSMTISDIDSLISMSGVFFDSDNNYRLFPYDIGNSTTIYVALLFSQYGLRVMNKYGGNISKVSVVMEYTKP